MAYITNTFDTKDGETICYYKWEAASTATFRGVVQLAHGIGEHAGRYDRFAQRLQKEGFTLYANDHRAHGKTAEIKRLYGFYEGDDYIQDAVSDMHQLYLRIQKAHPECFFVLMGHSMGSLLSRQFVLDDGHRIDALILSGTADFIDGLGHFGWFSTRLVTFFRGRHRSSDTLRKWFFNEFNKHFVPNRTHLDWISSVASEVDAFEADPYRIENFSVGIFTDILKYTRWLNQTSAFVNTPNELPILMFSGDCDPVGEMGEGVKRVADNFRKGGNQNLTFHLYEGGRHEMLNEKNSREVEDDILSWLYTQISKKGKHK